MTDIYCDCGNKLKPTYVIKCTLNKESMVDLIILCPKCGIEKQYKYKLKKIKSFCIEINKIYSRWGSKNE